MVKEAGAVGAAPVTSTVPAWTVVLVVDTAEPPLSLSDPMKETRTTPAPTAKMARPSMSIWVDRRIDIDLRSISVAQARRATFDSYSAAYGASLIARAGPLVMRSGTRDGCERGDKGQGGARPRHSGDSARSGPAGRSSVRSISATGSTTGSAAGPTAGPTAGRTGSAMTRAPAS